MELVLRGCVRREDGVEGRVGAERGDARLVNQELTEVRTGAHSKQV